MTDANTVRESILDLLQYYGAGAATLAALVISLHLGRVWTGTAFIIFVTSSLALIAWGFMSGEAEGIGWQNLVMLAINCLGVYRYLIAGGEKGTTEQKASQP